jgi:hypothetical protein
LFLSGPLLYTLDQIPLTPGPLVVVIKVASSQVQPNDNDNDNNINKTIMIIVLAGTTLPLV